MRLVTKFFNRAFQNAINNKIDLESSKGISGIAGMKRAAWNTTAAAEDITNNQIKRIEKLAKEGNTNGISEWRKKLIESGLKKRGMKVANKQNDVFQAFEKANNVKYTDLVDNALRHDASYKEDLESFLQRNKGKTEADFLNKIRGDRFGTDNYRVSNASNVDHGISYKMRDINKADQAGRDAFKMKQETIAAEKAKKLAEQEVMDAKIAAEKAKKEAERAAKYRTGGGSRGGSSSGGGSRGGGGSSAPTARQTGVSVKQPSGVKGIKPITVKKGLSGRTKGALLIGSGLAGAGALAYTLGRNNSNNNPPKKYGSQ